VTKISKHSSSNSQDRKEKAGDQLLRSFYDTFKSGPGSVVYDFLESQYNNTTSFVPGEPETTAYNEGCRAVFLQIKHNLEHWENRGK
jgi:hypothetical protein